MSRNNNEKFAKLIEDNWDEFERMFKAIIAPQEKVRVKVDCPRCKDWSGKSMKVMYVEADVPKYNTADVVKIVDLAARFGVSKPAERRELEVRVTPGSDLATKSDEELQAIVDGRALPSGEFPYA